MLIIGLLQRVLSLLSLAILAGGGYLVWSWFDLREAVQEAVPGSDLSPQDWRLWVGGAMLAWSFLGRLLMLPLLGRSEPDADRLRRGQGARLVTADGADLHLEHDGAVEGPTLVLVHGWGMDATFWREARSQLGRRFHLAMFDLAGLGKSRVPKDGEISLDRFADELRAVVEAQAPRKVLLVGHSIGGMIVQTFAVRHADLVQSRVAGLVLENTTHHDPTRTMILSGLIHPLKPMVKVLMRLDILLSPLLHLMNWQSYLSGHMQLAMRIGGFGARPSRAQVDHTALLSTKASPAVKAKGNLAMIDWSVTEHLPRISAPALVFTGGRDIVTKAEAGEQIVALMPNAREVRIADAGHMGPLERAADYNRAIETFAMEMFGPVAGETTARPSRQREDKLREIRTFQPPPTL